MDGCTVVSWNLNGLDDRSLDERTEAACFALLLRTEPVEIIALQELVRRSWHGHVRHHLHHAGYDVLPADPTATDSEYFSAIAVRRDLQVSGSGVQPFAGSQMGRALVWVRAGGWWFGTGHLESGTAAHTERCAQLAQVASRLGAEAGPAVFAGDTNLRRDEARGVPGMAEVTDAWIALGSDRSTRATWIGGRYGARFDRVLHNRSARSVRLWTTGADAANGIRPSDHVALWASLERAP